MGKVVPTPQEVLMAGPTPEDLPHHQKKPPAILGTRVHPSVLGHNTTFTLIQIDCYICKTPLS
jgi:hypothetical protein